MAEIIDFVAKPMPGLWQAIEGGFKNLFNFGGRMRRSEYWMFIAAVCVLYAGICLGCYYLVEAVPEPDEPTMSESPKWLSVITAVLMAIIFFVIPLFCLLGATVRRLHDTGRSGLLAWLTFASVAIGAAYLVIDMMRNDYQDPGDWVVWCVLGTCVLIIVTVVFCLKDSEKGPNQYGGSPKWERIENHAP